MSTSVHFYPRVPELLKLCFCFFFFLFKQLFLRIDFLWNMVLKYPPHVNIIIILAFSAQDPNEFFQAAFVFLSFYVQYKGLGGKFGEYGIEKLFCKRFL